MGRSELLEKHISGMNWSFQRYLPKIICFVDHNINELSGLPHSMLSFPSSLLLFPTSKPAVPVCGGHAYYCVRSLHSNSYLEDYGDFSIFVSAFYSKPRRHHRHISIILYRRALVSQYQLVKVWQILIPLYTRHFRHSLRSTTLSTLSVNLGKLPFIQ